MVLLAIGIGLIGCKKDDSNSDNNNNSTAITSTTTDYFKATIGGTTVNFTAAPDLGWSSFDNFTTYTANIYQSITNTTNFGGVQVGIMDISDAAGGSTKQRFEAFFAPGLRSIRTLNEANGIEIQYGDGTKNYSSAGYSGTATNQAGSSITITEMVPITSGFSNYVKVKFTFNCKLYPVDGSGSPVLELTNGEAVLDYAMY